MTTDRIDELLSKTAYPESNSVREAMLQVWNELQQDFNSRKCVNCTYKHMPFKTSNYIKCIHREGGMAFHPTTYGCNNWCEEEL